MNIRMSTSQFRYLEDYASQKHNSTAEVHSILSSMLQDFRLAVVFLDTVSDGKIHDLNYTCTC